MAIILSLIKYKFLGIEQRPKDVVQDLLRVGIGADEFFELGCLVTRRFAAQAAEVEVLNDLFGRLSLFEEFLDHAALFDLGLQSVAVEQVQRLRKVRICLDLARTYACARRPAKGGEKIIRRVALGDSHRARA